MNDAEIRRLMKIAELALEEWAGWLDDARGTISEECEHMKKELKELREKYYKGSK